MTEQIPKTDRELLFETTLRLEALEQRVGSHGLENRQAHEKICAALCDIKDRIAEDKELLIREIAALEIRAVKDDRATNIRHLVQNGVVSAIMGVISAALTAFAMMSRTGK